MSINLSLIKLNFLVTDNNKLCRLCDYTCETCYLPLNSEACLSCNGTRYLLNTTCVEDCGDGY